MFFCDPFTYMRGINQSCPLSMLLYIISVKVLAIFIDVDTKIKGVQVRHHEKEIINFADDTTVFERDINYLNRIQSILKLYEKGFFKIISKFQTFWAGTYKNRIGMVTILH